MTRNFIPDVVHIIDNAETDWLQFPYWERAIACDTFTFFHWLTQKDLITATFLLRNFKEYATILNHLRKDVGEHLLESSCQDPRECEINPSNAWVHLRSPATKSTHMSVICDEFWYNLETGQSTFTPPEGFAPPEFQRKCDASRAILEPSLSSPDDSKVRLANNKPSEERIGASKTEVPLKSHRGASTQSHAALAFPKDLLIVRLESSGILGKEVAPSLPN
eukprot:CAMPEP_0185754060 /NCGR_PEP_ID=MMETSP1174-20130828/12726_1 /TAXON_ID=35687 /ORGANISM="Dictyocha speculum, Strain CCMP1381" /LENGTH=220 /DNA_ID=CAMNT_0028432127 /DNA_START=61 /DNA_END=724 /DNA_ORIENTATION=+